MYPRPTHTPEKTISRRRPWHRLQLFVDDIDEHILDGAAQRNSFSMRRAVH